MSSERDIYKATGKLPGKMFITTDGKFICNRHGCNYFDYPSLKPECECLGCNKVFMRCKCPGDFCSACAS